MFKLNYVACAVYIMVASLFSVSLANYCCRTVFVQADL